MFKKSLTLLVIALHLLPVHAQTLTKGMILKNGDKLYSPNKACYLSITSEGNLTINEPNGYSWVALDLKKTVSPIVLPAGESYSLTLQTGTGKLGIESKSGVKWSTAKVGDKVVLGDNGQLVQYSNNVAIWRSPIPKPSFVVETLGKQGVLEFPFPTGNLSTTTPTLTLYGMVKTDATVYKITNGSWNNGIFTGRLMRGDAPTQPAVFPTRSTGQQYLKFKFTSGTYGLLGAINALPSYNMWFLDNTLFLGYGQNKTITFPAPKPKLFALVLNDKETRGVNGGYDYGWWMLPTTAVTGNFRTLTLLDDRLKNELSLYAFKNTTYLTDRPLAGIEKCKIKSYNIKEIVDGLAAIYTDSGVDRSYVIAGLAPQMINFAQAEYMPEVLGIKSSGHGSPDGVMNGILGEPIQIKNALTLVKNFRGKPLDFFDFATNCNVASLHNFEPMAGLVNYVVASDLTRNSPPSSIGTRPDDEGNYANYFASDRDVSVILSKMLDSYDVSLNSPQSKLFYNANTLPSWKQQLTLFNMQQFPAILNNIGGVNVYDTCAEKMSSLTALYYPEDWWLQADFKSAIPQLFPNYTTFSSDWNKFAIKKINNRRSLNWDTTKPDGMTIHRKW